MPPPRPDWSAVSSEPKETGRVEAFSDGVFAFAITLLVLNLKDPTLDPLSQKPLVVGLLFADLLAQWPALFALITSFATILIMWVNHHNMFTQIRRIDTTFLFLNGLLLFFVVLTPFTTQLIASHVKVSQDADGRTAAVLYSGSFFLLGLAWTIAGWYSFSRRLVIGGEAARRIYVGPVAYAIAVGLSFVSGLASVVLILAIAAFFTVYARDIWRVTTPSK